MKHVAIAGATDGIGIALAIEYAARGWDVALLGREAAKVEAALAEVGAAGPGAAVGVLWNATEADDAARAFDEAALRLGQVDLFVYVAGLWLTGDDARSRGDAAARMMEVNVTGAIRILDHAAEYMRAAGRGRLAAVGSIAGDRGRKQNPAYAASKAAIETYMEGLRHQLHGSGVGVSTVKPGWVRTRMLKDPVPAFPPAVTATAAARTIERGLRRGREVFYVPWWWGLVGLALRLMPRFLFKRVAPA